MSKKSSWVDTRWRPVMGWLYMATCAFDFLIAPIAHAIMQAAMKVDAITQWNPITLQGAGLYHLAMGAIVGVTAWSRGQEKINGVDGYGRFPTYGTTYDKPPSNSIRVSKPSRFNPKSEPNTNEPIQRMGPRFERD